MKRFRLINILIISITMALFTGVMVSCSQDVSVSRVDLDFAALKFVFNFEKLVSDTTDDTYISSFEFSGDVDISTIAYKALCVSKPGAEGEVNEWTNIYESKKAKSFSKDVEKTIQIEYGTWDFYCIGYNSNGDPVCEAEATDVNVSSEKPVVDIVFYPSGSSNVGNSVIMFDIATPNRVNSYLEVSYRAVGEEEFEILPEDFFSVSMNSNEYGMTDPTFIRFYNDATNSGKTLSLPMGSYEMKIVYYAEGLLWTEYTITPEVFTILGNSAYTIRGHFNDTVFETEGEGVDLNFEMMSMLTHLYVNVTGSSTSKQYFATIINPNVTGETYRWFVDGFETNCHNKVFTYTPTVESGARTHIISCVCTAIAGGDTIIGSAYVENYYSLEALEALNE